MKRTLLMTVSAFVLMAGIARADNNSSIDQLYSNNGAYVDQTGDGTSNTSYITQKGDSNRVGWGPGLGVVQTGTIQTNYSQIDQGTDNGYSTNNYATVSQTGVNGADNNSWIRQNGNGNSADVQQANTYDGNSSEVYQNGNSNQATVRQGGVFPGVDNKYDYSYISQSGTMSWASVTQDGDPLNPDLADNHSTILQTGNGVAWNYATVNQGGTVLNTSWLSQNGSGNNIVVNQH